jgi:hypothetical protein
VIVIVAVVVESSKTLWSFPFGPSSSSIASMSLLLASNVTWPTVGIRKRCFGFELVTASDPGRNWKLAFRVSDQEGPFPGNDSFWIDVDQNGYPELEEKM